MFTPFSNSVSINIASLMKNNPSFESMLGDNTSNSVDMDNWETNTVALLNTLIRAHRERAELEERAKARFNQQITALMGASPVSSLNSLQATEHDIAASLLRAQASLQLQELQRQQQLMSVQGDRLSSLLYSDTPSASASMPAAGHLFLSDQVGNLALMPTYQQPMQPMHLQSRLAESKLRKGRVGAFPQKLHRMLLDLEESGNADLASFLPNKPGFIIRKPEEFSKKILPKYFQGMSRFSSFQRQLNLYDFVRIHTGPEKGAYCHDLFIKDQPALCTWMQRNKIKSLVKDTDSK